jgi:large subunit ribosomal protein L17
MRHRVATKRFNRNTTQRRALLVGLTRQLVEHGQIETTIDKAKVVRQWVEKAITKAKKGTISARRDLHSVFGKRDVVNTLVDRVAPAMGDRTSGFVSIKKLGNRRGDDALLVKLSLIATPDKGMGSLKKPVDSKDADKSPAKTAQKTKPAVKRLEKTAITAQPAAATSQPASDRSKKSSSGPKTTGGVSRVSTQRTTNK